MASGCGGGVLSAVATGPVSHPVTRSPVLVGRAAELAMARGLVDGLAAGRGAVLLVAGEAGIGKTRLLDEVAARAADGGLTVLSGRAVQGGGTFRAVAGAVLVLDDPAHAAHPTLRGYRTALGRLLPSWAEPGTGASPGLDADPVVVLAEGLLRLLRLARGESPGCVLRLEDVHWADDDTLALVEQLASAVAETPLLVACSARDDAPAHAARRLAAAPGTITLHLRRLGERDVAALAAACRGGEPLAPDEVRRLLARSDGLPFAVEELVAAPHTAVPPTLASLVADRLAALDEPARAVLHAAAVLGPELDWRLLAPTVDTAEDDVLRALRAAVGQALLVADGAALRWPHALTRDAVAASLLSPERAALAGRAARVLADRAGPDDEPRAAELFVEAGEPDVAARLLLRLARRDAAHGALRSAEQHLTAAADARPGRELAAEVAVERIAVLTQVGRAGDALALGADQLAGLRGDAHAELCLQLARTAVTAGMWAEAESFVMRAGRPADPRSLVLRADAALGAGHLADARELATAAIERAEEADAPAALCEALGVAGRVAWLHDLDVTEALARRAAQVAGEHGLAPWRVAALFQLAMMRMLRAGDRETINSARELAVDAGMLGQVAAIDYVRSDYTWQVDGPATALPIARAAAELVRLLRLPQLAYSAEAMVELLEAMSRIAAGEAPAVAFLPTAVTPGAHRTIGVLLTQALHAVAALVDHDLPRAADELRTLVRPMLAREAALPPLAYLGASALLDAAVGGPGTDARTYPATQNPSNRGAFAWADAIACGRTGRPDEAAALLAEGDDLLAGQPWWRRLLHPVVLECAVADGWGDPVPLLRADLAAHEHAGEVLLARTCRDLLRRAGAPSPRRRGGQAVPVPLRALGVTAREAEVLGLVVQGMTNAQVAQRLFLSPRTVDTHVANLLAKTGAGTRAELRSFAEVTR